MATACVQAYDQFGAPALGQEEVSTGTTILAATFNNGVIIGADSRTSSSTFVANRVADKLTKITDNIYCCRSGSASDTQAIADIVRYHLAFQRAETGEEPTVATAAAVFQELCYSYRDQLLAGILVAGVDKHKGGQVFNIPLGGMCIERKFSMGGSGSTYIFGYVDSNYKENMTEEEARQFMINSIALAISRDGSSGGVIRLAIITNDGNVRKECLTGNQIPKPNVI